jgi:hypothetical protein
VEAAATAAAEKRSLLFFFYFFFNNNNHNNISSIIGKGTHKTTRIKNRNEINEEKNNALFASYSLSLSRFYFNETINLATVKKKVKKKHVYFISAATMCINMVCIPLREKQNKPEKRKRYIIYGWNG